MNCWKVATPTICSSDVLVKRSKELNNRFALPSTMDCPDAVVTSHNNTKRQRRPWRLTVMHNILTSAFDISRSRKFTTVLWQTTIVVESNALAHIIAKDNIVRMPLTCMIIMLVEKGVHVDEISHEYRAHVPTSRRQARRQKQKRSIAAWPVHDLDWHSV